MASRSATKASTKAVSLPGARLDRLTLPVPLHGRGPLERRADLVVAGEPPLGIDAAVDGADRPLHVVAADRDAVRCHAASQMISK